MEYREFTGKSLDDALDNACAYYNVKKEYLDYEVIKVNKKKDYLSKNESEYLIKARPKQTFEELTEKQPEEILKPTENLSDEAKEIVSICDRIIKLTTYEFRTTVYENDEDIKIEISGPNMKNLLQIEGEGIEALKYLIYRIYTKKDRQMVKRLHLDINDYIKEKENYIKKLAHRISMKVKENARGMLVNPMNAYDRRIFHLEVEKIEGVSTESIGNGPLKRIKVFPK